MAGTSGTRQTIVVGLWGSDSAGHSWDDGSYTGVREIELSYNTDAIGSFSVVYDLNGQPFQGLRHTNTVHFNARTVKIQLQFPEEYLVSVSGHTSCLSWTETPVVRSLTFKTNKRSFGPYGEEKGTPFNLPIENGLIVGFKGRTGGLMDAIGFHLSL